MCDRTDVGGRSPRCEVTLTTGQWHLSTPPSSLFYSSSTKSFHQWFNFPKQICWWKSCKVWATKAHDKECRRSIYDQWHLFTPPSPLFQRGIFTKSIIVLNVFKSCYLNKLTTMASGIYPLPLPLSSNTASFHQWIFFVLISCIGLVLNTS